MLRLLISIWMVASGRLLGMFQTVLTTIRLKAYGVRGGSNLRVRGWVDLHIHRTASVSIGSDCRIKSGFAENPVGGFRRMGIWVYKNGRLSIGNNVGISGSTLVCANSVTIEDDVYIGGACNIFDTDFHSITPHYRLERPDTHVQTAPVVIKQRSFIGGHSLILKGVTIGEEAVIGAGSVVTKDVPSGEIWAGNPAKCIGYVDAPDS